MRKGEIVIPAEKAQALAGMRSATTKKLVEASPHCASETSLSFQRSAGRWAWERQSCILSSPSFRRSERRGRRRPLLGDRRLGLLCRPHRPAHRQRRRQRTRRCDRQLCFCSVRRASIPHFVASTESLRPPPHSARQLWPPACHWLFPCRGASRQSEAASGIAGASVVALRACGLWLWPLLVGKKATVG